MKLSALKHLSYLNRRLSDHLISPGKNGRYLRFGLLSLIIIPVIVSVLIGYSSSRETLTQLTLQQRQATATLAARTLQERFDHLTNLGISLATRVQFRKLVSEGKWIEAQAILNDTPRHFPFIDQVFLADTAGTVMTDSLNNQKRIVGKSFAHRDWYKGVSASWTPYVSEVYQRANKPIYNVVTVAVPIKDDAGQRHGILGLQIPVKELTSWITEVKVGTSGFIYLVDKKGHLAAHQAYPDDGEIVDYSSVPSVKRALGGQSAVEVAYNPVEGEHRLAASAPVPTYGWGAIATESVSSAFAARDAELRKSLFIGLGLISLSLLLAYILLRIINTLKNYRQKEQVMLESIGDGLVAIDRNWKIILWNRMAYEITGWPAQEAIGQHLQAIVRFVRDSDGQPHFEFIDNAIKSGQAGSIENHTLLIRKDGSKISVGDSAAPILDQKGNISGAIIVFRDTSKEYELEHSREEFFSIASHELRTPLTAIRGNASLIRQYFWDKLNDASLKEMISDIHESSVRLIGIVNDFLDTSRLEQKRMKFELESLDPVSVAESVIKEYEVTSSRQKVNLGIIKPDNPLPVVLADKNRVKQILINLVGNALKFTEDGNVTISFRQEDNFVKVLVSDTGKGMSEEAQKKLFHKFEQTGGSPMTRDSVRGTGLGLYISKMIVEQMQGRISLESSTLGKGTTFSFTLPTAKKVET